MNRQEKRKAERLTAQIIKTAKQDMIKWVETLDHAPTEAEAAAWQNGYLDGMNRINAYIEEVV